MHIYRTSQRTPAELDRDRLLEELENDSLYGDFLNPPLSEQQLKRDDCIRAISSPLRAKLREIISARIKDSVIIDRIIGLMDSQIEEMSSILHLQIEKFEENEVQ